jgi:hypothetical protein
VISVSDCCESVIVDPPLGGLVIFNTRPVEAATKGPEFQPGSTPEKLPPKELRHRRNSGPKADHRNRKEPGPLLLDLGLEPCLRQVPLSQ